MRALPTTEIVTTCTRDCPSTCGLVARVKDGRVVSLTGNPAHPVTHGRTCGKLSRYLERVYSPNRILYPLRRTDTGWRRISWDDALDDIANRMAVLRREKGPASILYYRGFGIRTGLQLINDRFFNAFGGVTTLNGTLCGGTGEAAQNLDFGRRISHDPLDHVNARTVILWGRNPAATQQPLVPIINEMRRRGGAAILIDPVATETLRCVDRHIQPAPGRDVWLALAVAARLVERGWVNDAFLDRHAEGRERFLKLVGRWRKRDLIRAAEVSEAEVDDLAERMAKATPTAILLGWGLHRWTRAHETIRAIDALAAVTGNIGVSGGGVSQGFDEYAPYDMTLRGEAMASTRRQLLMPKIGEEILSATDPKIELIFVTAGNPLNMAPDSQKVAEAFRKTPFVVYCGQFMDDTADAADLFLPVTSFLEERDVVAGYGHDVVGPVNPAVPPLREAKSHFQIFRELATRLSIGGFEKGEDAWLEDLLHGSGIDLDRIRSGPVRLGVPPVPFTDKRFPTPSGKFQLLGDIESRPSPVADATWPFALLSTSRKRYLCSEQLPEDHPRLPTVTISKQAASKLGLSTGQEVTVESRLGAVTAVLMVDSRQRNDVALFPRGGWTRLGHGVNTLTESRVSEVGNGAAFYETRVRIVPAPAPAGQ